MRKGLESYESGKPMEYEEIIKMIDREHPLVYTNKTELKLLLSLGVLVDWGRRWFSLSKNELNCEMISASQFSFQDAELIEWISHPKSRFSYVAKMERPRDMNIDVEIETYFLSPGITYAAYLVFKYCDDSDREEEKGEEEEDMTYEPTFVGLKYKLKEAGESSIAYLADRANDGWMLLELCQFIGCKKATKLEVSLECFTDYNDILLEGIQFLPIDNAINDESIHEVERAHMEETNREQILPDDYREIIKMAKDNVPHKIPDKDLYLLLSNGILTNKGQSFFYLDKDGVKCCMQAARTVLKADDCFRLISTHQSRFEKVTECESSNYFCIKLHVICHMLSPNTTYATYLVYKLPEASHGAFESPLEVDLSHRFRYGRNKGPFTFLTSPKTEVINLVQEDGVRERSSHMNPLNRPKLDGIPRKRIDGWMETQIWAFTTDAPAKTISQKLTLSFCDKEEFTGLIVQGVEIRPK